MEPAFVNLLAAGKHVWDIEVFLQVLQERDWCINHALPYGLCWPRVMTVGLMEHIMAMKNTFPAKAGISTTMSLATIVNGCQPLDTAKLTLPFDAYIHLNVDINNPTKQSYEHQPRSSTPTISTHQQHSNSPTTSPS